LQIIFLYTNRNVQITKQRATVRYGYIFAVSLSHNHALGYLYCHFVTNLNNVLALLGLQI